jgi:RHS repeat-associated protein
MARIPVALLAACTLILHVFALPLRAQPGDVIDTVYTSGSNANLMYHDPDTSVAGVPQDYNGDGEVDWRDAYAFAEDAAFVTQSGNGVVPDLSDLDDVIDLMRIFGGEATADPGDSDDIICADLQRAAEVLNFPYTGRYPSQTELSAIDTGPCSPPPGTPPVHTLPGGPGPFWCLGVDCPDPIIDLTSCDTVATCDDDVLIPLGGATFPTNPEDVDLPDEPLLIGEDISPRGDDHGTGPAGDLLLIGSICPESISGVLCGSGLSNDEYQGESPQSMGGPWFPEGWEATDGSGLVGPPLVLEDMFPNGLGLGSGTLDATIDLTRGVLSPFPKTFDADDVLLSSEIDRPSTSTAAGSSSVPISGGGSAGGGGGGGGGGSGGGGGGGGGGSGGGGGGSAGGGGGEDGGESGNPCGEAPAGGGEGVYGDPVLMALGHKYEIVTDAVVALPGTDFRLVRTYLSNPDETGPSLIGSNWSANIFASLYYDSSNDELQLHDGSLHKYVVYENDSGTWKPSGTSQKVIDKTTIMIDTITYPVWQLKYASGGRAYFFREPGSGESAPGSGPYSGSGDYAKMSGLLLRTEDAYGTGHTYEYRIYGTSSRRARLKTINLACALSSTSSSAAQIRLAWYLVTGEVGGIPVGADHPLNGKLARLIVVRDPQGTPVETQRLEYTYKHGLDGFSADVGTAGDLIEVVKYTRVDAWTDTSTPHTPSHPHLTFVSQYRYHDVMVTAPTTGDLRLQIAGKDHQLKIVIRPEQMEYAAQQVNRGGYLTQYSAAIRDLGYRMLRLDDDRGVFKHEGSSDFIEVADLATKIVGYSSSGEVDAQFVQAGCGCGPAAQGIKQAYQYNDWPAGTSTVVTETLRGSGGAYMDAYRTTRYDLEVFSGLYGGYLINKVISDNTGSGRTWVWHFEYGDTTDAPGATSRFWTPSAVATYTAPTISTSPSVTAASGGLIVGYDYDARGRRVQIAAINSSATSTLKPIVHITYPVSDGPGVRRYLPTRIERYSADSSPSASETETTWYEYGFDGDATTSHKLSWRRTIWEAETEAENGPATGLTYQGVTAYDSYRLFNEKGQVEWLRHADQSIMGIVYDTTTGTVTQRVSNALISSVPTGSYSGITFTSWGKDPGGTALTGGQLTWTTDRNAMGQSTKLTSPGGIVREVYREARPLDRGHVNERPGIHFLVTTLLPAKDGSDLEAPVMMTASGAIGKVYQSSFTIDSGQTYAKTNLVALLDEEVSRTTWQYAYTGLLQGLRAWPDASSSATANYDETTYERDGVGRLLEMTSPDGSVVGVTAYDVLGRPLGIQVGTTTSSSLETVVEYFYDDPDDPATDTDQDQGVGNGRLSWVKRHFGEDASGTSQDTQATLHAYDYRDRWVRSKGPHGPYVVVEYDNLNRIVAAGVYETAVTSLTAADRKYYVQANYSQRGLLYRQRVATDPDSSSTPAFLDANYWRDASGRPIAFWGIGGPTHKRSLDGHGRVVHEYMTDRADDAQPGAIGNYADALDVTGDHVLSQTSYTYDTSLNRIGLVTTRDRLHDSTSTGALGSSNSVAQFVGVIYDGLARPIRVIDYGTNGSTFASGTSAPTWPPGTTPSFDTSGWGNTRIVAFEYDGQGRLYKTTDPMGVISKSQFDDFGRVIASIGNYRDASVLWSGGSFAVSGIAQVASGSPASDAIGTDQVTTYEYEFGRLVRQTAHNHDGTSQSAQHTEYLYGVTAASSTGDMNSLLDSNILIKEVRFPDPSTGAASSSNAIKVAYNLLGQVRGVEDQNGTIHRYDRDLSGRVVADRAATLGSGLLNLVDKIGVEYDDLGRTSKIVSSKLGTVKNAVQAEYTDAWQLLRVLQDHDGDITVSAPGVPSGNTKMLEYAYSVSQIDGDGGNFSRPTMVTYPSETDVTYHYGDPGSLNDRLSRLESIDADHFGTLVDYEWLGAGLPVLVSYPDPGIELDRIHGGDGSSTAGAYKGFDRFGQLVRHLWVDTGFGPHGTISGMPNGPPLVDLAFERNAHGSPTLRRDARPSATILDPARDFRLGYDGLNRLVQADRGLHDGSSFTPATGGKSWELDLLANVNAMLTDVDGNGDYDDIGDTTEPRTFDKVNEILTRGSGGSQISYTHDDNGNLKTVTGGRQYYYDAWDRLVCVKQENLIIAEFEYNGLNWRTLKREDDDGISGLDVEVRYVYSPNWQILEEDVDEACNGNCDEKAQYFWGVRYLDDIIARRIDHDADGDYSDTGTRTYFYATDERGSPVAIVDATGALVERVDYNSYGVAQHRWPGDLDGNGATSTLENTKFGDLQSNTYDYNDAEYNADLDLNRDGLADSSDYTIFDASWKDKVALSSGQISSSSGPASEIGMAGYVWTAKAEIYCVRYRYYDPMLGRWLQRDPAGYVDGLNLYTYGMGNPWAFTDPYGLFSWTDLSNPASDLVYDGVVALMSLGDGAWNDMIAGVEQALKDKICQNYHNGDITADEAAQAWGQVNGMADDAETALAQIRIHETQLVIQTAIDIAITVIPVGAAVNGAAKVVGSVGRAVGRGCSAGGCSIGGRLCFVAGTLILASAGELVPVESVELGDRVESAAYAQPPTYGSLEFGHAGAEDNASPVINDYETIDPAFWCTVELSVSFEDGSQLSATLLRPQVWLTHTEAVEGETIWLELPEMEFAGIAVVVSISPAPASIKPGHHATGTVTGRFATTYTETLDLYLDSSNRPLGVTPSHPVWSLSREGWVAAGDLYQGESVATIDGSVRVVGTVPAGERTVYNLEVLGHHTYFVGDNGVWVHNACPPIEPGRLQHVLRHMADNPSRNVPHTVFVAQSREAVEAVVRRAIEASGAGPGFRGTVDLGVTIGRQLGNPAFANYGQAATGMFLHLNRAGRARVAYPVILP